MEVEVQEEGGEGEMQEEGGEVEDEDEVEVGGNEDEEEWEDAAEEEEEHPPPLPPHPAPNPPPLPPVAAPGEPGAPPGEGEGEGAEGLVQDDLPDLQGEEVDLQGRVTPEVPPPRPPPPHEEGDGWAQIDRVGAWASMLSSFDAMDEVPSQYVPIWCWAYGEVLRRVQEASPGLQLDRALMWLCFLPQALCRKPKRGGKGGRGLVAKRFNCLARDKDWGELVRLWEVDTRLERERRGRRREERETTEEEEDARKRRKVLLHYGNGQVSKGVRTILSHGVANIDDPRVKEQLERKNPPRVRELPPSVAKGEAVPNLRGLREGLLNLRRLGSPGTGGLRPEYLITLGEHLQAPQMELLESFGLRYLNGELPAWFYRVFLTCQTVPLHKTKERTGVRPIGVRNPLLRVLHREVVNQNRQEFIDYLEPQQLAMSQAGGAKLVFSTRMLMEENPTFVAIKIDADNAFNSCSRMSCLEALQEEDSLRHLACHAATTLAPHTALESGGKRWGEAQEGDVQGDPLSAPWYNVSWHKYVRRLDAEVAARRGQARFGMDDGVVCGPEEVVFPALARFEANILTNCSISLNHAKTEVFTWDGRRPALCPPGMKQAGTMVDGVFEPGFLVYGVPVGTDAYVSHTLREKVREVEEKVVSCCRVLGQERQALWTTLKMSISQTFDYWIQLVYPSQIQAAAMEIDKVYWRMLEACTGSSIPREEEGLGYEAVVDMPVRGLEGLSFQSWVAMLPTSKGGLGIRRQVDVSLTGFLGALEQTVPFFAGERGVCPQLGHMVGREEDGELQRWAPLLATNCRTARELRRAHQLLRGEAEECCALLGRDLPTNLAVEVEGVGLGSEDGSTRGKLTEEREVLRAAAYRQAIYGYRDQSAMAVMAWKNRDKLSTAWLMALPGPDSSLTSPQFGEAMCLLLALPSLCCRDRVGEKVGRRRVDLFGVAVLNENLEGGGFTRRHDTVKLELNSMAAYCGVNSVCEPYGIFGSLAPQQPLHRLQAGQARVVIRPDFLLELPDQAAHQLPSQHTRNVVETLADVKTISIGGLSYYKPGATEEKAAVAIRAAQISNEYRRKAEKLDRELGHQDGQGPASRRLRRYAGGQVLDLVLGGYAEGSQGVWTLLGHMANCRLRKLGLARGSPGSQKELAILTHRLRKRLSLAVIRANVSLLLERMRQVGEGAELACRRRGVAASEEVKERWGRRADWMARVTGHNLVQKGSFLLD